MNFICPIVSWLFGNVSWKTSPVVEQILTVIVGDCSFLILNIAFNFSVILLTKTKSRKRTKKTFFLFLVSFFSVAFERNTKRKLWYNRNTHTHTRKNQKKNEDIFSHFGLRYRYISGWWDRTKEKQSTYTYKSTKRNRGFLLPCLKYISVFACCRIEINERETGYVYTDIEETELMYKDKLQWSITCGETNANYVKKEENKKIHVFFCCPSFRC